MSTWRRSPCRGASGTDLGRLRRLKRPSLRRRGGPRHRCPSHRHRCTDPGKTLAYTQPRGVVAAIDDPQGVKPRVIFVTCPLVPLTRRCFRLARGPLGGTAETPRTSCNSRVDGKISVIFPSFVHLSLRVRRSRPVRSEKRIDRTLELLYTKDASETELTVKPGSVDVGGH
jgi:hypothetical protein